MPRQNDEGMVPDEFEHVGVASVVDGDTIDIRERRYRFNGTDSPERGSLCGTTNVYQKSSFALAELVDGRNVECVPNGEMNGDRIIATCFALAPNGENINLSEQMVADGWSRDWPRFSNGRYAQAEFNARASGLGIWGLDCPNELRGNRNYE